MSYQAIIAKIQVRPHPNADRLQLGVVAGNQVVVGLDTVDGDIGVFFPCNGVLSQKHCDHNDLLPRFDDKGARIGGGYFDTNRRVRAQKFRGEKSEGFFQPLSSLLWTGANVSKLEVGLTFDTLNGHQVCEKWINPATLRYSKKNSACRIRKSNPLFLEHADTLQFNYEVGNIPVGSLIYISEKCHGTSHRLGLLKDEKPWPFWFKHIAKLLRLNPRKEYAYLNGSRRVVLNDRSGISYYGTDQFRYNAVQGITLHKDETLYGEIVGFIETGAAIMSQPVESAELKKKYGDRMVYSYGCLPGTCKFLVYRITRINDDGKIVELSWPQIVGRCKELNIPTVPHLYGPTLFDFHSSDLIKFVVTNFSEGMSTIDASHIREGVVVRIETPTGETYWLKNKQFVFKVLEGIAKEQNVVDLEEAS